MVQLIALNSSDIALILRLQRLGCLIGYLNIIEKILCYFLILLDVVFTRSYDICIINFGWF